MTKHVVHLMKDPPPSRDLLHAVADRLQAAAPRLAEIVDKGRRFTALYEVPQGVLGACPGCGVWPGEPHEPQWDGRDECDPRQVFRGSVPRQELVAVAVIVRIFRKVATSYCAGAPLGRDQLLLLFADAAGALRAEAAFPANGRHGDGVVEAVAWPPGR